MLASVVVAGLAAWLLTYAIHSTLLLGAAGLAAARLSVEKSLLKERLWRGALVGGLLTATLQLALGPAPLDVLGVADAWRIADAPAAAVPEGAPVAHGAAADGSGAAAGALDERERTRLTLAALHAQLAAATGAPPDAPARLAGEPRAAAVPGRPRAPRWPRVLVALWAAVAGLGLARLGLACRALRRGLAGRSDVRISTMRSTLARLAHAAGRRRAPRLTAARELATPITIGLWRPEICVPTRALHDLGPAEQEALLAHELAHAVRRDPARLLITRVLEALFFFQPLNRLARRRLAELAEYACDDWAVQRTGRRLALARCLTEVAAWIVGPARPLPAVAMAERGSRLGGRVQRLLNAERAALAAPPHGRVAAALLAVLGAVAAAAPGVAAGPAEPAPRERGATAPEPRAASSPSPAPAAELAPAGAPPSPPASSPRAALRFEPQAPAPASAPAEPATEPGAAAGERARLLVAAQRTLDTALAELDAEVAALRAELAEETADEALDARLGAELDRIERRVTELQRMRVRWMQLLARHLESVAARTARPDGPPSSQHR